MKSALCRRDFVTRGLVLAGAVLLFPAHRLCAAVGSSAALGGPRTGDAAHDAIVALAARYGEVLDVSISNSVTQITVRVRCFDTMLQSLSEARKQGIRRVHASGNTIAFTHDSRRFEIKNLHHGA